MATVILRNKVATFLACELDCNSGRLTVGDIKQKLEPMVHQFLLLLIEHQGKLLSRTIVIETLWPNKDPSDEALRAMVKKAREALKDNARNPTYIKTIPTKGYVLIPPVVLASTVVKSWLQKYSTLTLLTGLFITLLLIISAWYFLSGSQWHDDAEKIVIKKTNISVLKNESVSTYYINGLLKTIWIEASEMNDASQLTIEDVLTKQQQKIIFTSPLKRQFWYSQASQRIVVMRNDDEGFYSILFHRQDKEPTVFEHKTTLSSDSRILGADVSGKFLFVASTLENSIGLFSLELGMLLGIDETPPAIADISVQINKLREESLAIAPSNTSQSMLFDIWPSPIDSGFVVKMESPYMSRVLYFATIGSDTPTYEIDISGGLQSAVWNAQGNRFSFTTDNGSLMSFQTQDGRLTLFNTNGELINQVVADCGASCFVIANTQGIPKLRELSLSTTLSPTDAESPSQYAQVVVTNSLARNEYLPSYSQRGLYFVSQEASFLNIVFRDNKNIETIIYEFDKQDTIDELVVEASDDYVAGIVNKRPFVLDLNTMKIRYIPLSFPKVSHIAFAEKKPDTGQAISFYAETRLGSQLADSSQNTGLYQYQLDTQELSLVEAGVKVRQSIELVEATEIGDKLYSAIFRLNNNRQGVVEFQDNKQIMTFNIAANDCMSCWQLKGNYLFEIMPSYSNTEQSYLLQTNLLTGVQTKEALLFNGLQNQFSLHPSNHKMVLTTRQSLQTELTQIEGLSQIY